MSIERIEELEKQLEELVYFANSCKTNVDDDITTLHQKVTRLESILEEHASQRAVSHYKLESSIKELARWFETHDKNEMEKYNELALGHATMSERYKELTDEIRSLIIETRDNTDYIKSEEAEKEKLKAVADAIAELNRPKKEMMQKVKMTVITVLTTALTGALVSGIFFVYDLYRKING